MNFATGSGTRRFFVGDRYLPSNEDRIVYLAALRHARLFADSVSEKV